MLACICCSLAFNNDWFFVCLLLCLLLPLQGVARRAQGTVCNLLIKLHVLKVPVALFHRSCQWYTYYTEDICTMYSRIQFVAYVHVHKEP